MYQTTDCLFFVRVRYTLLDDCPDLLSLEDQWCTAVLASIYGTAPAAPVKTRAAYKATQYQRSPEVSDRVTVTGMYPLVEGHPNNAAVICHVFRLAMKVASCSEEKLPPAIGGDLPSAKSAYYALWSKDQLPTDIAEDEAFSEVMVILGLFHWELTLYKALGKIIQGSGLDRALINCKAISNDRMTKLLGVKMPVSEMRPLYEAMFIALHYLAHTAYLSSDCKDVVQFSVWRDQQAKDSTMASFLFVVMRIISIAFNLTDAIREVNVDGLIRMMQASLPVFYAADHPNYLKWGSVALCYLLKWRTDERYLTAFRKSFCRFDIHRQRNFVSLDQATEMSLKEIAIHSQSGMPKQRLQKIVLAHPCLKQLTKVVEDEMGLPPAQRSSRVTTANPSDASSEFLYIYMHICHDHSH